jgi:hypothetical protein
MMLESELSLRLGVVHKLMRVVSLDPRSQQRVIVASYIA